MLNKQFGIYDFNIKSYHTDQVGRLTLPAIFHFLQECAWDNARVNNFGFEHLEEQNAFWVLSKIYIEVDEYPFWKDNIQIKTWPKGVDGLFAIRDFQIIKNEKVIANATSYWLILDRTTGRPKRLNDFNFIHDNFLKESAIEIQLNKLEVPSELKLDDTRKVYYSDLDVNMHVNNGTYVRWILDSYFSNHNKEINLFEINFLSELKLNDTFHVFSDIQKDESFYVLKNEKNRDVCKARLK